VVRLFSCVVDSAWICLLVKPSAQLLRAQRLQALCRQCPDLIATEIAKLRGGPCGHLQSRQRSDFRRRQQNDLLRFKRLDLVGSQ
jgi:hypothetical protein